MIDARCWETSCSVSLRGLCSSQQQTRRRDVLTLGVSVGQQLQPTAGGLGQVRRRHCLSMQGSVLRCIFAVGMPSCRLVWSHLSKISAEKSPRRSRRKSIAGQPRAVNQIFGSYSAVLSTVSVKVDLGPAILHNAKASYLRY